MNSSTFQARGTLVGVYVNRHRHETGGSGGAAAALGLGAAVAVVFMAAEGTPQVLGEEVGENDEVSMCGWGARGMFRTCEEGTQEPSDRRTAPSPEWGMVYGRQLSEPGIL
ncbi:unnamed protein product [Parascedosporium putredinis]|uniref:Uncharacterized protein n=1 Tax=Parascedosporium putredinis TaxID=1442378 RepID=A0A9P1MD38_9PEZI|nr:unnamed protein product [Parascedosporium putredinis]CAI8002884.1 unnamed protein product [Parascedosporium putredinis]